MTTTDSLWLWGLLSAFVLPLLIALRSSGVPGIAAFIGANVLMTVSLLAYAGLHHMASELAGGIFRIAAALALAMLFVGMRQFLGLAVPARHNRIPILCGIALLAVMLSLFQNASVPAMILSAASSIVLGDVGFKLLHLRRQPFERFTWTYVAAVMLVLSVLHGLCALAHGVGLGVAGQMSGFAAAAREFNVLAWVLTPAMFLGLALLVHNRVIHAPRFSRSLDHLTGAHTKRTFLRSLADEGRHSEESGSPFALLLLDVDDLGAINARYGHAAGDDVLRHVTSIVRSQVRGIDRFARLDGGTFALLMHDTDSAGALTVCTRLRERLRHEPCRTAAGKTLIVTTSGGLTVWRPKDASRDVLGRSDMALKHARAIGHDTLVVASGEPSTLQQLEMAPWGSRSSPAQASMPGSGRWA